MDTPHPPPADSKPDDTPLQTEIVSNIPMHAAGGPSAPAKPQDENKIMRDVGDQLAKEDHSKPKHHLFSKPKPAAPLVAQPLAATQPSAQNQASVPAAAAHQPNAKPQPNSKLAKPKSSVPVAAIAITVLVTGGLIFLAYSALK